MFTVSFATGYVFPPYWANHPSVVKKFDTNVTQAQVTNIPFAMPLKIKWPEEAEYFELPIEPVVTISGRATIIRRNVAKANKESKRGSVVETWSTDDYDITIGGLFMSDDEDTLPEELIRKLREYCEARRPLVVESKMFTLFNITKIIIEEWSFPHTKGMQNQMFALKAYSYETPQLIISEVEGDIAEITITG